MRNLGANAISPPLGDSIHPRHIVQSTYNHAVYNKLDILGYSLVGSAKNLHANPGHAVRSVPKAHIAGIRPSLGWPPGHHQEEHLNQVVKHQEHVPNPKLRSRQLVAASTPPNNKDAQSHCQAKHGLGVRLQTNHKLKSIAGGRRRNHDKRHEPLEQVRPDWRAKGLRRHPEVGKGQHALAADFADHARLANQHSQEVAIGTQQNEYIERRFRTARAEDGREEDTGRDFLGRCELGLVHGSKVGDVAEDVQNRHNQD